jgi:ammonium transporter, Amt family
MRKKLTILVGTAVGLMLMGTLPALAQTDAVTPEAAMEAATTVGNSLNLLWLVLGAMLVIFMQAGFALVETGLCRAKHAAHVVLTNFAIFGLGFIAFFSVGYAFMFGAVDLTGYFGGGEPLSGLIGFGENGGIISHGGFFMSGGAYTPAILGFFLYQVAFMDTVATIPTGSMAERWNLKNFVIWGFFCGAIYYPLYGCWVWGGGWLSKLGSSVGLGHGVVDFAGSGVVHAMGGMAALAGAIVIGPRLGKFGKDGKPRLLAPHNIPMAVLGCFILLFGWFGFNAASTFAATDIRFAVVAANTAIAAAFGATAALFWVWSRTKKPDPTMSLNGMLAGLVGITAPCAFVAPWAAALIGLICGVVVIEACWFFERRKIDDPVGAISVHGVCGLLGVLFVGIFADGTYGEGWNGIEGGVTGILYGDPGQLGAQAVAVLVLTTVMLGIAYAFFKISNLITPIRSLPDDEIAGLDLAEIGISAYDPPVGVPASQPVLNGLASGPAKQPVLD